MSSVARCRGVYDCAPWLLPQVRGLGDLSKQYHARPTNSAITQLIAIGLPMTVVHFSADSNRVARVIAGEPGSIVLGPVDVG